MDLSTSLFTLAIHHLCNHRQLHQSHQFFLVSISILIHLELSLITTKWTIRKDIILTNSTGLHHTAYHCTINRICNPPSNASLTVCFCNQILIVHNDTTKESWRDYKYMPSRNFVKSFTKEEIGMLLTYLENSKCKDGKIIALIL